MMIRRFVLMLLMLQPGVCAAQDLSIAAAASLKESIEAVGKQYETAHGTKVHFTYGSSGELMTQIDQGAPIDVFLSAARKQVDQLANSKKADAATATRFARNELVLITPANGKWSGSFQKLADSDMHRLAVGDPRTVPAGDYAKQTLDHLKLSDALKGRLVYGQNVRQVLQYVQDGDVDAGIVYLTDAREAGDKVKQIATADANWHQPIEYWGIVVAASANQDDAKKFLDYLKSDPAQAIFKSAGFAAPTTKPTTQPAANTTAKPAGGQ